MHRWRILIIGGGWEKMNKELINKIRESYCPNGDEFSDEEIADNVLFDYDNLVELRNRIEYEIECDKIYEEDINTLDHILDYIELFINLIKGDKE